MEDRVQVTALVKSPTKDRHQRKGSGFSLLEIKKANKSIEEIKKLKLRIDYFRKSMYDENVEKLKNLKSIPKKKKSREPFVPKVKKRTEFKPKVRKVKKTTPKKVEPTPKKRIEKTKVAPPKQKLIELEKVISKKPKEEAKGIPLTELSGLGPATANKFIELGVSTVEELMHENPAELGTLIKGVSEDRIKKWIEEGKELLNQ